MGSKIADEAIKARAHLVEALKGLDEIIRLANEAGRDDVVKAAEAAKQPIEKAAESFNEEVERAGGDASKMDPIKIDKADKAADEADETCKELVDALKRRVEATEKVAQATNQNIADWGFGPDRDEEGRPIPRPGSWARFISEMGFNHEETLYGKDGKSGLTAGVRKLSSTLDDHHQALYGQLGEPGLTGRVWVLEDSVEQLKENAGKSSFPFNGRVAGAGGAATLLALFTLFLLLSMDPWTALIASTFVALVMAILFGLFFDSKNKTSKQRNPFGSKDKTSSWKNIFRPNNK